MLQEKTLEDTIKIAGLVNQLYKTASSGGSEISNALVDFTKEAQIEWALIGGLAIGFHTKPRATQDIDVIVYSESDIDKLEKQLSSFKRNRSHAFEHKKTGVEIEVLTASFLGRNSELFSTAIKNAEKQNVQDVSVPVVDKAGLIALKLGRSSRQDLADIESILTKEPKVDISMYPLTDEQKDIVEEIRKEKK